MKNSQVNSSQFVLYTGNGASLTTHFIPFHFRINSQTVSVSK